MTIFRRKMFLYITPDKADHSFFCLREDVNLREFDIFIFFLDFFDVYEYTHVRKCFRSCVTIASDPLSSVRVADRTFFCVFDPREFRIILIRNMDEWDRFPPVSLTGKEPITELVVHFFLSESFFFCFFCEDTASITRSESIVFSRTYQYSLLTECCILEISSQNSLLRIPTKISCLYEFFIDLFFVCPNIL